MHILLDSSGNLPGETLEEWHEIAPTLSEARAVLGDDITVIPPAVQFCYEGQCHTANGGRALFYDSHHMTVFAARPLAPVNLDDVGAPSRTRSRVPSRPGSSWMQASENDNGRDQSQRKPAQ